jgi:hypothetical protein
MFRAAVMIGNGVLLKNILGRSQLYPNRAAIGCGNWVLVNNIVGCSSGFLYRTPTPKLLRFSGTMVGSWESVWATLNVVLKKTPVQVLKLNVPCRR